jgi:hypothetical protein
MKNPIQHWLGGSGGIIIWKKRHSRPMSVGCPQRFVQDCLKKDGHGEALFYRLLFNI